MDVSDHVGVKNFKRKMKYIHLKIKNLPSVHFFKKR